MKTNSPEFQKILVEVKRSGYLKEITEIANQVVLFYPKCLTRLGQDLGDYKIEHETSLFILNGLLHSLNKISQNPDDHFEIDLLSDLDLETVNSYFNMWNEMFTEYALRYDLWETGGLSSEEVIGSRAITQMEISEIFIQLRDRATKNEKCV